MPSFLRRMRFWKKRSAPKASAGLDQSKAILITAEGNGGVSMLGGGSGVYETVQSKLVQQHRLSESLNTATAVSIPMIPTAGVLYPEDMKDYPNYYTIATCIPYVARALDIKQNMIWQSGYDLESQNETTLKIVAQYLDSIEAEQTIREGSFDALIYGNMYWRVDPSKKKYTPLNPERMGIRIDEKAANGDPYSAIVGYVYTPKYGEKIELKKEEVLHLAYNRQPWGVFGISPLKRVLPVVQVILDMEKMMPTIVKRRADPLLHAEISDSEGDPLPDSEWKKIKNEIVNRPTGEDIFSNGRDMIRLNEVIKSGGAGSRQTVEPLLEHFIDNLVAGLGVPEVALGFGGTSTMATAEYQERLLEAEIRYYQRILKRFHEHSIFPLVIYDPTLKLSWKPLSPEDKAELSTQLQGEIKMGIITPEYAAHRLGYEKDAREGTLMTDISLKPFGTEASLPSVSSEEKAERLKLLKSLNAANEKKDKKG